MKRIQKKYSGRITVAALLITALIFLFTRIEGTLTGEIRDFVPANPSAMDRIVISTNESDLALELRDDGKWMVSDGSTVRLDRMSLLFAFMERLEVVSPVSNRIREDVIKHLMEEGTAVQIFVHGRLDKNFRICYDTTDIRGTYMMQTRKEAPYMVRLKGYQGDNLESIFATDRKVWQDNLLLDLAPEEIREIRVDYPPVSTQSFVLSHSGPGSFRLSGQAGQVPDAQVDVQEMEDYLHFFSNIRFEYAMGQRAESRMQSDTPFAVLRVVSAGGREDGLKGFRLRAVEEADGIDMGRFMGLIHDDQDTVMLKYEDMDPIFRRLEDFQKK